MVRCFFPGILGFPCKEGFSIDFLEGTEGKQVKFICAV